MANAELKEPALFSSSDGDTSDTPARQGKLFVRVVLHDILWPFRKFLVFILQSSTPSRQLLKLHTSQLMLLPLIQVSPLNNRG
jgi:hypothetical protein